MRFVANGPDIPAALLRAHQDGKVVFFCGAGVSKDAGIPLFSELTEEIFRRLSPLKTADQQQACHDKRYDMALGSLERLTPDRRSILRTVHDITLEKRLGCKTDGRPTLTHEALLRLSRFQDAETGENRIRIVSTNFDRLFEDAKSFLGVDEQSYVAPGLPIPSVKDWHGIVHLHGLLPDSPGESVNAFLVLTSGDFGRAYLENGWATRFVVELFRNFTVCFIGYSLDDALLRYMTEAFQASIRSWRTPNGHLFAFVPDDEPTTFETELKWRAKGVTPIVYPCPEGSHRLLHATLQTWADVDSCRGRIGIVESFKRSAPSADSDHIDQLLWALSDSDGAPARSFAAQEPCPPLDWLPVFEKDGSFGLQKHVDALFPQPEEESGSPISLAFASWLARHVSDPRLLFWVRAKNRAPTFFFRAKLEQAIARMVELDHGKSRSVKNMQTVWALFFDGKLIEDRLWSSEFWRRILESYAPDHPLFQESLEHQLSPRLVPTGWSSSHVCWSTDYSTYPKHLCELKSWSVSVGDLHILNLSDEFVKGTEYCINNRLADQTLLSLYQSLTTRALNYYQLLYGSSRYEFNEIPSIAPHPANDCKEWCVLVFLLRDSWIDLSVKNPQKAMCIARLWLQHDHVLFRRLGLFCLTRLEAIDLKTCCSLLRLFSETNQRSGGSRRELSCLVDAVTKRFSDTAESERAELSKLASSMGIPSVSESDAELERATIKICDVNLSERYTGALLPDDSHQLAKQIVEAHAGGVVFVDAEDDLPRFWDYEWRAKCAKDPCVCLDALVLSSEEGIWAEQCWSAALDVWNSGGRVVPVWPKLHAFLQGDLPRFFRFALSESLASVVRNAATAVAEGEFEGLLEECERIIDVFDGVPLEDLSEAGTGDRIRKGVESVAHAVSEIRTRSRQGYHDRVPDHCRTLLTRLFDFKQPKYSVARKAVAQHMCLLSRCDPCWAVRTILPSLSWETSREAAVIWAGVLSSSLDSRFLLGSRVFPHFCAVSRPGNFSKLDEESRCRYSTILVQLLVGSHVKSTSQKRSLQSVVAALPVANGLLVIVERLRSEIDSSTRDSRQSPELAWESIVKPFLQSYWHFASRPAIRPTPFDIAGPTISETTKLLSSRHEQDLLTERQMSGRILQLCVACQSHFPEAYSILKYHIHAIDHIGLDLIQQEQLEQKYPELVVDVLTRSAKESTEEFDWFAAKFDNLLSSILSVAPCLRESEQFKKLQSQFGRFRDLLVETDRGMLG